MPKKYFHKIIFIKKDLKFKNVTLKIKPFFYGRRISDYEPRDNKFSCSSEILAVLADGNVVPCRLAYDDSISLGKIKDGNLNEILRENKFLKNLRNINGEKHLTVKSVLANQQKEACSLKNS